ncbi:MAG TPA: hypothetical protein PLG34_13455 [Spirochaetota bacterium]|jgi:uncharacterized iron-regulated protein|nr:hypothetical protein [Spirochaetota bacterium]HPY88976.1 hypothetical protein [Spirochaetota bacterium]HQB60153.1 hypothetical protein [Spirochaetota bacterium]
MDQQQQESPIIQICGLWLNEKKDGSSKYMKGLSGNVEYLIFKNKNKIEEKQPDYYLCLSKHRKKEVATTEIEDPFEVTDDEDIPF